MNDNWAMPLLVGVIVVICVITLCPIITGEPITKGQAIVATFMIVVWTIGFIISYVKEKSDYNYEIAKLKRKIEKLESRKEEKENGTK